MPQDRKTPDDFWDIASLLPKKARANLSSFTGSPTLSDLQFGQEQSQRENRLTTSAPAADRASTEETFSYTPEDNRFLLSVIVSHRKSNYSFYEHFVREGRRYFGEPGPEVPYTSFFSYIPQYGQLSPEQRAYYFYFRQCVRERKPCKTDFSYFMLLVYEILNLPDLIPPEEGLSLMVYLWTTYRAEMPQMDKYLAAWLPDYCLMYRLPCPTEALTPILSHVLAAADFKEFYLGYASELNEASVDSLTALCSDYQWRYSRYATEELLPKFRQVMPKVLLPVFARLFQEENIGVLAGEAVKEHDAFTGSLCAHNMRCHIKAVYHPFAETPRLRHILTLSIKYAENRIRAAAGIKSRLSVTGLSPEYRLLLDRLMSDWQAKKKETEKAPEPSYLSQYEAESTVLSLEDAAGIEQSSWDVTRWLVPEGSEEESLSLLPADASREENHRPTANTSPVTVAATEPEPRPATQLPWEVPGTDAGTESPPRRYGLSEEAFCYLAALSEKRPYTPPKGCLTETLAEEINEAFCTYFDDIILEEDGAGGFRLCTYYEEEVTQWIRKET